MHKTIQMKIFNVSGFRRFAQLSTWSQYNCQFAGYSMYKNESCINVYCAKLSGFVCRSKVHKLDYIFPAYFFVAAIKNQQLIMSFITVLHWAVFYILFWNCIFSKGSLEVCHFFQTLHFCIAVFNNKKHSGIWTVVQVRPWKRKK